MTYEGLIVIHCCYYQSMVRRGVGCTDMPAEVVVSLDACGGTVLYRAKQIFRIRPTRVFDCLLLRRRLLPYLYTFVAGAASLISLYRVSLRYAVFERMATEVTLVILKSTVTTIES
jgi:hypothetical protein